MYGNFRSAVLDEYITWLKGYMNQGGVPTHYHDFSFLQFGRVVCVTGMFGLENERPPLHIIVEANGKLDPRKSDVGHHTLLYLSKYESEDRKGSPALHVPIFNDDAFLSIRGIDPHIKRLVAKNSAGSSGRERYRR
ncbi:MAG TPA: hypothetical protein VD907_06365 [Verrucomicrobiae bacterium]|nr:hypothetical protein [Verrucomicrobiae bacterium]